MEAEARMYQLLQQMKSSSVTYISVGHRPSLLAFHSKRLRLMGNSGSTDADDDRKHYDDDEGGYEWADIIENNPTILSS